MHFAACHKLYAKAKLQNKWVFIIERSSIGSLYIGIESVAARSMNCMGCLQQGCGIWVALPFHAAMPPVSHSGYNRNKAHACGDNGFVETTGVWLGSKISLIPFPEPSLTLRIIAINSASNWYFSCRLHFCSMIKKKAPIKKMYEDKKQAEYVLSYVLG